MPAPGSGLTFPRPHPSGEDFAKRAREEPVPFLLELFNRQTVGECKQQYADIAFACELDEQTEVFLCNELGFVAAVALILS